MSHHYFFSSKFLEEISEDHTIVRTFVLNGPRKGQQHCLGRLVQPGPCIFSLRKWVIDRYSYKTEDKLWLLREAGNTHFPTSAVSVGTPRSICYDPKLNINYSSFFKKYLLKLSSCSEKLTQKLQFLNLPARSHRTAQIRFIDPSSVTAVYRSGAWWIRSLSQEHQLLGTTHTLRPRGLLILLGFSSTTVFRVEIKSPFEQMGYNNRKLCVTFF